jgi:hypothetical protein
MNRKRKLILLIALVISLLCAFYAVLQGKWEDIHYNAVCCNCLQKARFHVKKYLGITYYKECALIRPDVGLNPSSDSGNRIPESDPNLYEQIFGEKCRHYFLKQGMISQRTSTFFKSGAIRCGDYLGDGSYGRRLKGIGSIYRLFELTQDKIQAQNSFRIIDTLHPVGERQPRAGQILEMYVDEIGEVTNLERWKRTNQEYFKMLQLEN